MKKITMFLLAGFCSLQVQALSVIVHPSNTSEIDEQTINRIFLGKAKSFPNGSPATPLNLDEGAAATDAFNEKVLSRSSSQLKAYWSKLLFTGKGTPPEAVANDAKMLEMVAADPSAIGYVEGDPGANVKVVATF